MKKVFLQLARNDTVVRTAKTFVQVFLGTLIPALTLALAEPPATWAELLPWLGGIFTPKLILGDCLSAAICAVWNGLRNAGGGGKDV